ncbi:hypothetical protein ABPG72_003862 [Tetrahymena utriculariae]
MSSTQANNKKAALPQFAVQVRNDKLENVFECIICKQISKTIPLFQRHLTEERHLQALEKIKEVAQKKKEVQQLQLKRAALEDQEEVAEKLRKEEEEELKRLEEIEKQEALARYVLQKQGVYCKINFHYLQDGRIQKIKEELEQFKKDLQNEEEDEVVQNARSLIDKIKNRKKLKK